MNEGKLHVVKTVSHQSDILVVVAIARNMKSRKLNLKQTKNVRGKRKIDMS